LTFGPEEQGSRIGPSALTLRASVHSLDLAGEAEKELTGFKSSQAAIMPDQKLI
jgi:hypothetical protein